jgi:DNA-binding beta-propeller fold protein YncE
MGESGWRGAYVLCEGLWRQDNATLTRFDASTATVTNDVFSRINPGLRLGDTANDMVLKGDTLYIAVSTSRTVEIVRASTGVWLGRIRLAGNRPEPRYCTIVNDSVAFVSTLNDDSIVEFNPTTFAVRPQRISVGPAPEGIASTARYVFVANSGFGDFRAGEPKAGTISVVDVATRREVRTLTGVPNVTRLLISPDKSRLYAVYGHLFSQKDSLGGIVEYNTATLQELRRWRMKSPSAPAFSATADMLFYLSAAGVDALVLAGSGVQLPVSIVKSAARESWYGLGVNPATAELWIANARDYTSNGEVIVVRTNGVVVRRFDVGINPNSVVFF